MSSPDEDSVWEPGLCPEGGERGEVSREPGHGLDVGAPRSGEGEGGLPVSEGLEAEREVMEGAGAVLWGREGRPGSPADEQEDALDYTPRLAEETAGIGKQLTDQEALGVGRNPSQKNRALHMSSMWADLDESPSGRSAPSPSCEELQQASPGGRSWGNSRKGPKSQLNIPEDLLRPSTEGMASALYHTESSDEFSEMQMMKVNIYPKEGSQTVPSNLEDPGDTSRHLKPQVRKNIFHVPSSFQASISRGLVLATEWQPVGELELSSSKKMHSVVSAKTGSRPSHPGAAVAGSLPRATPKRKVAQEKKSSSGTSKVTLGRKSQAFPTWGQRVSGGILAPATFPPISGLPMLGRSRKYSLVHSGTKQSKHGNAGKKPVVCRPRNSELVTGEDNDQSRDPVPRGQLPTKRPGISCLSMHHGEFSSVDPKTRRPQVPGGSQSLALSHGGMSPRGPAHSGHQEPLDLPPRQERQQQPPGAQGCPGVKFSLVPRNPTPI